MTTGARTRSHPAPAARADRASRAWRWHWAFRGGGAAALAATAWIHWHLYDIGFSSIPTIGHLFLLNAALGVLAALAVLLTPRRWLALVELAGGLLLAGTLAALGASMTIGLFGYTETWDAPLVRRTIAVEAAGAVLLVVAALLHGLPDPRQLRRGIGGTHPRAGA